MESKTPKFDALIEKILSELVPHLRFCIECKKELIIDTYNLKKVYNNDVLNFKNGLLVINNIFSKWNGSKLKGNKADYNKSTETCNSYIIENELNKYNMFEFFNLDTNNLLLLEDLENIHKLEELEKSDNYKSICIFEDDEEPHKI